MPGRGPRAAPWEVVGTRLPFNQSTAADHTVLAAQGSGKKIRVLFFELAHAAAVTLTWKGATTAISSPYPFPALGVWTCSPPFQQFETGDNEALVLTLGDAVAVQGDIWYEVINA